MTYDLSAYDGLAPSPDDIALAAHLAPVIRFSADEPFLPSHVAISVLREAGPSPSAPLPVEFGPGVSRVIEYAIWWDWDIQHLYELEHIWLKLDADDAIVSVEASAHGKMLAMRRDDGSLPIENGRVTLYSEPGKHAFHAGPETILARRDQLAIACRELAGHGDVLVNEMFAAAFARITAADHRAARRYLQDRAFVPAFDFRRDFNLAETHLTSWRELHGYISTRVPAVLAELRANQPMIEAVLIDSGDTLVDEGTELFDADGYVTSAELIPGARAMVEELAREGYRLVLVADGRHKSFATVLGGHGLRQHLEAEIISEVLGCEKPDRRMFEAALSALGIPPENAGRTVMIGNHLERDIKGANRLGIVSIWQNWSPRRSKVPADADEVPAHVVRTPGEVPELLAQIERQMLRRSRLG